jgi:aspartyl-tRNA(Asn)/glutamyl-tRNA(Gln) amidotransferase subunit A
MSAAALTDLSMTEAADAVARGEVTSLALTESCLARIDRHAAALNCVVRLDREAALEAAAAADAARGRPGAATGPLHGVPMMHKDMYYRAGMAKAMCSRPEIWAA